MGKRIELPAQPSGNATEQLQKMYSYLYQVATTINANLDEIGGMEFTDEEMLIVNKILNPDGAEEGTPAYSYREAETLKSLIIKTANFVQQSLSEYRMNLLGEYVAEGKFGKYVRKTGLDVEITPEHIMQNYQLQEIIQGLKVYEINAKNYIKTGLLRTEEMLPVYGVAIGKDIVTFAEDGTETYNDGNKVAELTADALSFWQGGNMIAKYTGGRVIFYYGSTEVFYLQNGKIYAAGDLEIVTGKKLIISTETFSIDGNGNVVLKGDVEIKSGKSLAIKSGGTFTVDSGNFSIDAQGNATFKGGGEFSGELRAAIGTFAGELSAATGTFAGSLSAATGTFAGSLNAATGTFAGTMSAACITSGTMSCERLYGGNLVLGGADNVSGKLIIKDENNNVIGRWNKDGIEALKGKFKGELIAATGTFAGTMSAACVTSGTMNFERLYGGNLVLGGNNNETGKLIIKDENNNVIGRWNKDGIEALKGSFKGELIAATGTFAGSLSAATGTFAGSLSAATGTFAGSLNAATGTFAGTMSAACITSGTMSCERLYGGNLVLGGADNVSGKLIIKDENGNVIGRWNKDGIEALKGTFKGELIAATGTFAGTMSAACITSGTMSCERLQGGNLVLGGANNASGKIIIKDENGNTIGRWNKDGIEALKGSFKGELIAATGTFAGTMSAACITSGTMNFERLYGGNLVLGGADNVTGKLIIKDENNNVIGRWNKDGIEALKGSFKGELIAATGTFAGTMSAACVTSGTMSCERLSGGTLTLGGNNNTNGRLIIKNGSGTTVGTWDKDGIVVGAGGSFVVESGSAFIVYSDNMDIDGGGMTIKSGVIKGKHYTEDGVPLLAGNDVVVASTAPTGAPGRIWLKPLDSVGVNYSKNISAVTNVNGFSSTLTTSGQTAGAGSNNSYRLRMLIRAETSSGSGIDVTITVASALTFTAHIPPGYYDSQGYHGDTELDLTITNANWYGNNSSLAIGISAVGTGGESGMVNYYKIPIGSIQLVATSAGSSGSGWKSCEIKVYQ